VKIKRPNLAELGFIIGLIGIYVGLASLVPESNRLAAVITAIAASILTIVAFLFYLSAKSSPILEDYKKRFLLRFPCQEREIIEANKIAKRSFGKRNVTSDDHFVGLFHHNRLTVIVLFDRQRNETIGYIDAYPVKDEYLDGLRAGRYSEEDLSTKNVLTETETLAAHAIYLAGVVVDKRLEKFDRAQASACLLLACTKYFDNVVFAEGERQVRIGALAYTSDGLRLLLKHKFELKASAVERERLGDYFERIIVKKGALGGRKKNELRLPETICDLSLIEQFRFPDWRSR